MQPFLGEIRNFGFNFAPRGWASCNGQLLSIAQNTALFSLLGTTYGGNGQTTFALPDLRGRVPVGMGNGPGLSPIVQGEMAGQESHTLIASEMPQHNHVLNAKTAGGNQGGPSGNLLAASDQRNSQYATSATSGDTTMAATTIGTAGGNQPHNNMQPFLGSNFAIAVEGIFPARN